MSILSLVTPCVIGFIFTEEALDLIIIRMLKEGKRGKEREKEKISEKGLNYKPEVMDHM